MPIISDYVMKDRGSIQHLLPAFQLGIEVKRILGTIPYALSLVLVEGCLSKDVFVLLLRKLHLCDQSRKPD